MMRLRIVVALLFASLATITGVDAAPRRTAPAARVSWSVPQLERQLVAGQELVLTVRLTADRQVGQLSLQVSPDLADVVTISPATIKGIKAGGSVPVTITVHTPVSAAGGARGKVTGKAQGNAIVAPLPLELQWTAEADGNDGGAVVR